MSPSILHISSFSRHVIYMRNQTHKKVTVLQDYAFNLITRRRLSQVTRKANGEVSESESCECLSLCVCRVRIITQMLCIRLWQAALARRNGKPCAETRGWDSARAGDSPLQLRLVPWRYVSLCTVRSRGSAAGAAGADRCASFSGDRHRLRRPHAAPAQHDHRCHHRAHRRRGGHRSHGGHRIRRRRRRRHRDGRRSRRRRHRRHRGGRRIRHRHRRHDGHRIPHHHRRRRRRCRRRRRRCYCGSCTAGSWSRFARPRVRPHNLDQNVVWSGWRQSNFEKTTVHCSDQRILVLRWSLYTF